MKRIIAGIAAGLMLMGSGVRVYADEAEMVDKDEVIEVLWEENWLGRGDDGIIFPEASYKRHILEKWVSDNYGDDDYNWYDTGNLKYSYADYYKRLTAEWDFDEPIDRNITLYAGWEMCSYDIDDDGEDDYTFAEADHYGNSLGVDWM